MLYDGDYVTGYRLEYITYSLITNERKELLSNYDKKV